MTFFPLYVWSWYMALPVVFLLVTQRKRDQILALAVTAAALVSGPVWAMIKLEMLERKSVQALHHMTIPGLVILVLVVYFVSTLKLRTQNRAASSAK